MAPAGEQLALALRAEVADPVDDQPGGDLLALARGERGVLGLRDLGIGDPAAELVIPDGAGVADRVQASPGMAAVAARTLESMRRVTEKRAPAVQAAWTAGAP